MKRYRIITELGKGATGVVFRAIRSEDGSTVALKKLLLPGHLDAREEEDFIKRFKSEARAALALKHPGIVGALDCGLDEGTFYIAYELVEGVTLEQAIKSGREFNPEEVADILIQTAEALDHAHSEGVVHRDLSPGNIFITDDGKVRVSDFGVAGFITRETIIPDNQAIVGTPGYMAPEQITGSEPDPRSDIFSLGCVTYELLANKVAFQGENIAQIIHNVINRQPGPIRELNPKVPLGLEELIFRMLAKKTDYRYQNMEEVRTAAQRVLEEIPRARKSVVGDDAGHTPRLVVVGGPHNGETFDLQPTVTTIGRSIGDVLLSKDENVGQQHAWITREENIWVLYDADTDNGTFLNGESIRIEEILPGDSIQIGETVLEFRGAGGHVGVFKDSADEIAVATPFKTIGPLSVKKRFPWAVIILLMVPGIIIIGGLIVLGIIIPGNYISDLDDVTENRWESAFSRIDTTVVWGSGWLMDAADVLDEWRIDPLVAVGASGEDISGGPGNYMAPWWVFGNERINNEVQFRFDLFALAEEFLIAASHPAAAPDNVPQAANPAYQVIKGLESRIDGLEALKGVDDIWEGRKFQLLSLVRKWIAGTTSGGTNGQTGGYTAERNRARGSLLEGWYTYQQALQANDDLPLLASARDQLNNCIFTLDPILLDNPNDSNAAAMRGLAYFLGAEICHREGLVLGAQRFERGLMALNSSEADITSLSQTTWDQAIPLDFHSEFPTSDSVLAQIRALRSTLNLLLSRPIPGR